MFDRSIRAYLSQPASELMTGRGNPLETACLEITLANERFVTQRLRRLHLGMLLKRTDWMLNSLEELNLMGTSRVPELSRLQITHLAAELPFTYTLLMSGQPSPTEAIDLVFDMQEALLLFMTGTRPDDDELQEAS